MTADQRCAGPGRAANTGRDLKRAALHAFLIAMAVLWLLPLAFAVYTSLRPREETDAAGYLSLPTTINLDNYVDAWNQAELVRYFLNSLIIVVPAVLLVLFLASMMAFAVSRYSWRFNLIFLLLFTAANLLPPQVIITPLYRIFLRLWLPTDVGVTGFPSDNGLFYQQYIGIIAIHVAFQLGFCTFVLSNYMKTIPEELNEAARGGRRIDLEELPVGHPAAHTPGAGRARHAAGHVDLQRLLLGARCSCPARAPRCPSRRRSTTSRASSSPTTTCSALAPSWWPSRPSSSSSRSRSSSSAA